MINRDVLSDYLNDLLTVKNISDYCPNGLQVEGRENITRIVTGVTACQALLDEAVKHKADAVLVHHGYFWKGESPTIVATKAKRLKTLLTAQINLFAYHLPLDTHLQLGNNTQLAKLLDITELSRQSADGIDDLICFGEVAAQQTGEAFAALLTERLGQAPLHVATNRPIKSLAWCTGAAHRYLDLAIAQGVDAYLTGEISEPAVHLARESNIHLFAAGHHATERYGIQALGEHLALEFGIEHQFIEVANPV